MNRRMLALFFASLAAAYAAKAPGEDDVAAAEKAWSKAVGAGDHAAIEKMLHDQLIYAHSTGIIENKQEYLAKLRSGAQKYDAITYEKSTVQIHGNAAVTHSIVRMTGKTKGEPFDNRLMMLHTWVKQGGRWLLAAHQTTRLQQ